MKKKSVIFFILMLIAPLAAEEKSIYEKITISQAVSTALENNHDYKLAVSRLNQSEKKVQAAWSQLVPVLESEAALTRQYAENGGMSLSDGQYDIKLAQMRFSINPGSFYNSLQLSRNSFVSAKEDVNKLRNEIEFTVIKNYFAVLLSDELFKLRKESIDVLKQNLKDVESQYKTGSISKLELLQAQVQLKNQEPILLDAENACNSAIDYFNYSLGADIRKYAPDEKILSEVVYPIDEKNMKEDIEKLIETALKNRPEIIQIEKKKEIAENSKNISSSYYLWPTFSISGSYGYTKLIPNEMDTGMTGPFAPDFSQMTGTDEWQNTWQVRAAATYRWGAVLPVDKSRAEERESSEKIKEASEELLKMKQLISISIKSNYFKLNSSYITIQSQKENVAMAQESFRIARESYKAGLIKNAELLNADLSLTTAKTGYINAINSYYMASAELKKETGTDISLLLNHGEQK